MLKNAETILNHLTALYGAGTGRSTFERLCSLIDQHRPYLPTPHPHHFSERDVILITYGDMVQEPYKPPLKTLSNFLRTYVAEVINTVHLLPFYPYSSDDGFSVIDYRAVNAEMGTWNEIAGLAKDFKLMFDGVINHVSVKSHWFKAFLIDHPHFRDYFLVVDDGTDLSAVFRPRALPLVTPFETTNGRKWVWTTFSEDQADLNYRNPNVLLDIIDTLLFYVRKGAKLIRLDAIAYLWKEVGTNCIHLPETHRIIRLLRAVLDETVPQVALVTETNVPHEENVSYFGDGTNEAHMVYNFSLPPLVLDAFHTGKVITLSKWADKMTVPSDQVSFFNFTASHDGIGVVPARDLLDEAAIHAMARRVVDLGAGVSHRQNPDGSQSVYELNINYLDALADPGKTGEAPSVIAGRFLASQAIMLALRGVPGIYFHSLFGSRGWLDGLRQTGRPRTVNRERLQYEPLVRDLANPKSLRHLVFAGYSILLRCRTGNPAFHPHSEQIVLHSDESIFTLLRTTATGESWVLCVQNVTDEARDLTIDLGDVLGRRAERIVDLLGDASYTVGSQGQLNLSVRPYGVQWLTEFDAAEFQP